MRFQNSYSIEEKEKYLEEFKTSNLSIREFTKNNNIPTSTFRGWLDKEDEIRFGQINISDNNVNISAPRTTTVFASEYIRIELKHGYNKQFLKNILEVLMQYDK